MSKSDFEIKNFDEIENEMDFDTPLILRKSKTKAELMELFEDEDYQAISKMLGFITATFVLISTVSNFYLSFIAYENLNNNADQISFLFDNWKTNYITDIKTLQNEFICPDDYEPLFNKRWPGTHEGGYGPPDSNFKELEIGKCSDDQLSHRCKKIRKITGKSYVKFFGRLIGVKRSKDNFLTLKRPDSKGRCEKHDFRNCNPDSLPSRSVGVRIDEACPITDILISSDSSAQQYKNYSHALLEDNKMLLFSTQTNYLPVVQFKLTEGAPGIMDKESETTPNRMFYKLLERPRLEGCLTVLNENITHDARYRLVAGESEYSLMKDNYILQLLTLNPAYHGKDYSNDYIFNLYQKSYVRWKIQCEEAGLDRISIYAKVKNVEEAIYWQSAFNFVCLLSVLISGFIFGIINWFHKLYRLIILTSTRSTLTKIWDKSTNVVVIVFAFLKIALIFIGVFKIDQYKYSISIMQYNSCSDSITNQSFNTVGEAMVSSRSDNISALKI